MADLRLTRFGSNIITLTGTGRIALVGIATCYGLYGTGFEPQWRRDFPDPSRPVPRPTQPPVEWLAVPFPRGAAAGA
jgi:hypothetical protein